MSRYSCFAALGLWLCLGCSDDEEPSARPAERDAGVDAAATAPDASDAAAPPTDGMDAMDSDSDGGTERELLSQTGLYSDIETETLSALVKPYRPLHELWSDGAAKRRWLYLPPGEKINTTDMDYWVYPLGTKVWKEFTRDGVRVETRLLEKISADKWFMVAYQWNPEQTDAVAVPFGVKDASGTAHDIPAQADCGFCHENMPDKLLGVTAIQLSHELPGLTLRELSQSGLLSRTGTSERFVVPGTDVESKVLGYLHANCGLCHNPHSSVTSTVVMNLWLTTDKLRSVEETDTFATLVNVATTAGTAPCRIRPKNSSESAVHARMQVRGSTQMPPVGSEIADPLGLGLIESWINGLPAATTPCQPYTPTDGGRPDSGPVDASAD